MGHGLVVSFTRHEGRCPCCYKKTIIVPGVMLNQTREGWDNLFISRELALIYARQGICPWCGRATTIVTRILMRRFEPTAIANAREAGV